MKLLQSALASSLILGAFAIAQGQSAPDNTKQNEIDRTNRTASADMQKNDKLDMALTKQIRASVMADKSLSTYAHNVKIVAMNGNVTLSGVVHTQQEKDAIAAKAQAALQNGSLMNNLTVKP